ncbi:hypothetical protein D9M68_904720 [compost metagenome]
MVGLPSLVSREFHEPVAGRIGIRKSRIWVQGTFSVFCQQQFGRFATRASGTADSRTLLVGVFQKAGIAIDYILARETQQRASLKRCCRLLDAQVAHRRRSAPAQEK